MLYTVPSCAIQGRCALPTSAFTPDLFGAEDGGPLLSEGFEHIIQVTNDNQVQVVLEAWQKFNPAAPSGDPFSELKSTLPHSNFLIRVERKPSISDIAMLKGSRSICECFANSCVTN